MLALLVAVSLVLLTAYFGESAGGPLRAVQRGMLEVFAPIQEGASRALKPVRDAVGWFSDTAKAKDERDRLRTERDALRRQLISNQLDRRELVQLRGMVGLERASQLSAYRPVAARVIGRSPTVWYATINVDKGSNEGVRVDQPVVNGQGLVGKVSAVSGGAAQVTLITDHTSGVSAEVSDSGVQGLVQTAVGNPNDLILDFVTRGTRIQKGQRVITSGTRSNRLESLFPSGVPIGTVTKVDREELDLYQRVHIRPYADLRKLDFVQILTRPDARRGGEGARAQVTP